MLLGGVIHTSHLLEVISRPVVVTCSSLHRGAVPGLADGLRTCPALLFPGLVTAPSGNGALYPGDAGLPVQRSRHCLVLSGVTLTLAKVKCQCPPAFSVLLRVGVASKLQQRLLTPVGASSCFLLPFLSVLDVSPTLMHLCGRLITIVCTYSYS